MIETNSLAKENLRSVLFLVPSPLNIAPGQRFRFEQYLADLDRAGIRYAVRPYLSMRGRKRLYKMGNVAGKILSILGGYYRRMGDLFILHRYEYAYVHRWATTAGPPIFEWFITKILKKKMIYDFDDAIWLNESVYNKKFLSVKFLSKVSKICKWAHTVTVGNDYLYRYASRYNKNVKIIPTVVNTETVHSKLQNHDVNRPCVGWTGSFSTLQYLEMITPAIQQLQEEIDFTFYVIADRDPQLALKDYQFIKWNKESEATDLLRFHIGLMPLPESPYTNGKCGFKAIQYMALGIPALVSPVGVNKVIVDEGVNGFICNSVEEWKARIRQLLGDANLRKNMGMQARAKIEKFYSVNSTRQSFLELFS